MAGIQIDGVNNKIDFDDDADTSISSATDDTLVVEVGGNTLATVTATSVTVTLCLVSFSNLAFDLPKPRAPPPLPDCICRIKNIHTPINSSIGNHETNILSNGCIPDCSGLALIVTSLSFSVSIKLGSLGAYVEKLTPSIV